MKKVLLVTLQSVNIGNRLQNYALQTILKKLGCEVFTPYYDIPEVNTPKKRGKLYAKAILGFLGVRRYQSDYSFLKRKRRFAKFDAAFIDNRQKIAFDRAGQLPVEMYDCAVTGSDQVWHRWSDAPKELEYFYLYFMPPEKRIAYAPSFGFSAFPDADKSIHIAGIQNMQALSAREQSGKELMESVTQRPVEIVLDPTMLLTKEQWREIARKPAYAVPEHYILAYFLGPKSEACIHSIQQLAADKQWNVVDIFDEKCLAYFLTRPDEFIWLVDHAEYIVTNSFHACVFSILFQKSFTIYQREQQGYTAMFDRIATLLRHYQLTACVYEGTALLPEAVIDWEAVGTKLAADRERSIQYLQTQLEQAGQDG